MWSEEYIFSKGDLSKGIDSSPYSLVLELYFDNDISERYNHVCNMIERLEAEKAMLSELLPF